MQVFIALLFAVFAVGSEIPDWLPAGLLQVETGSYYRANGAIEYVDQTGDDDNDIGPFQMTRAAFETVSRPGEDFTRLHRDMHYADLKARAYMVWLFEHEAKGDWKKVAGMWNFGPSGSRRYPVGARNYANRVVASGQLSRRKG